MVKKKKQAKKKDRDSHGRTEKKGVKVAFKRTAGLHASAQGEPQARAQGCFDVPLRKEER